MTRKKYAEWAARTRIPLGFAMLALYAVYARPSLPRFAAGAAVAALGLALRAWATGHLDKNRSLATSGPYAYTRNPLYFGSLVLAAGFAFASRSWWIALIATAMFFAIYIPVIRSEEAFLQTHFPEFEEYARHVPRLFPRLRPYQNSKTSFSWDLYWKHREYNAALGTAFMIAAMTVKAMLGAAHR